REMEHQAAADRAAHHDRPLELERAAEGTHDLGIARRGEAVLRALPPVWRMRLAVPRHVEGQHAIVPGDLRVAHEVPPLPPVGTRRMQADERYAGAAFLEIDAVRAPADLHARITAENGLDLGAHLFSPSKRWRGSANRSLKYWRFAISG